MHVSSLSLAIYHKRGKFHWAKLLRLSHFSKKRGSFSYESISLKYKHIAIVPWPCTAKELPRKSIYCGYHKSLAQRKFPRLRYIASYVAIACIAI